MHLHGTLTPVYTSVIAVLIIQSLYSNCKAAVQLSCDSDNILEVVEGTSNNNVTCSGLDQTKEVEWWRNATQIGTCTPPTNGQDTCTGKTLAPTFVPVRKVPSESVMMINTMNPSDNIQIEHKSMKCNIPSQPPTSCDMDLIFPAEGSCLAKFIIQDPATWNVRTECNITKAYSSLERYKCEIYSVLSNTEAVISTVRSSALTSAGGKYKSFSCTFTGNMPTDEGLYSYKAIITPGRKIITATSIDSLEILRPTKSAVRCSPSPDVPENTNVTCTCSTNNIGKPGGRLKWYRGNNQIGTGEYGDSTLVMSQTLYRSDSGVTQFRCDVDWTSVTRGDIFNLSVGFIDAPELTIRLSRNVTVLENEIVEFACRANGKPIPTLSLLNSISNTRLNVTSSPLHYSISAVRCEDAATYTCIASNSMGKDTENSTNLYVNCRPRFTPVFDISSVNYINKTEQHYFTVVAYPPPDNFTFIYLDSDLNITKVPSGIYLNVICLPTQLVYNNTCTLTVDDVSPSAVGLYKVIISNKYGSANFTIKVDINVIRMEPCGLDNTLEIIEEKENNTVTCSGLKAEDNLTWVVETLNSSIVGRCPWPPENDVTDTCINIIQPDVFFPRRTSVNESILIINPTLIKNTFPWTSGKLSCQTQTFIHGCQLDLVYSAQGSCIVEFRRESDSWIVYGMCNITKAYSARGRYGCQWYQSLGALSHIAIGLFGMMTTVSIPSEEKYISGLCHSPRNFAMPTVEGNYSYTVTVIPGMVNISARGEILRPRRPSVSCSPSPYVPENRNITCTCNTQSVGVPGGRLQWSLARNNSFNVLNTGIYNVTNLEMLPQKLSLHDHETLQIRCDVDWAETIFGDTYTVLVGYSPSQPEMKLNQKMDELSVSESETVAFECHADGRPTPIIRLVNQNDTRQLGNSISPLLFNLTAIQCEDTGVYKCIADNGMGEDKSSITKLYVKCKPRGISGTISPKQLSTLVFIAQPVEQTFSVIAYPSPNNFTVMFLGSGKNTCESESIVKGVIMNVTYMHTENLYTTNVKLTIVNVTSAAAFGFYRIRLSNEYGHGDFVFEMQNPTISNEDEKDTLARDIGIGVGVGVGVMLAVDVVIIVVVWIYRQQLISKCGEKPNADTPYEMTTVSNVLQNKIETSYDIPEDNSNSKEHFTQTTMQPIACQQDSERLYNLPDDESSEAYDSMRKNDLGVISSYARLDQIQTVAVTSQEYQNVKRVDIKPHLTNTTII